MGDNSWRNIQCFPVPPIASLDNNGVYVTGTINWLAFHDYRCLDGLCWNITVEQYVILSLVSPLRHTLNCCCLNVFNKVPCYQPKLVVLMDFLCFCLDYEETHFVIIWQMKDFGVHESWIQLFKISYNNFLSIMELKWFNLSPLYLSGNGDTLILTNDVDNEAFLYNCIDNTVKKIVITNDLVWWQATHHIECYCYYKVHFCYAYAFPDLQLYFFSCFL
ncbi:hypothetical protein MtrunA17_Chr4g0008891 [Medicago truncatula]|uniref:F-box protein interaction domain protein n=1 Tax=Medicago truncatula TaxID=3880 RepID=A0A396I088_MEDTR|nr:hypothetical protein MtrunA17_Chr4g0008891 [Medicago truncatula]